MTAVDHILRAMTDDDAFRVMTLRATDTVREAVEAQEALGVGCAEFAQALMGATLVRETMAPMFRVQIALRDRLGNQVIGDSWPDGKVRGLLTLDNELEGFQYGAGALFQVVRQMRHGKEHQGIIEPEDGRGFAGALHDYFLRSEQIETMVDVAVVIENGEVVAAGGYVVQLLPNLPEPPLVQMKERLAKLPDLAGILKASDDPKALMARVLGDSEATELADSPVRFGCTCDATKVTGAVSLLSLAELEGLVQKGESLSVRCHYCNTTYMMDEKGLTEALALRTERGEGPDAESPPSA